MIDIQAIRMRNQIFKLCLNEVDGDRCARCHNIALDSGQLCDEVEKLREERELVIDRASGCMLFLSYPSFGCPVFLALDTEGGTDPDYFVPRTTGGQR